jgi:hypothetical protein
MTKPNTYVLRIEGTRKEILNALPELKEKVKGMHEKDYMDYLLSGAQFSFVEAIEGWNT